MIGNLWTPLFIHLSTHERLFPVLNFLHPIMVTKKQPTNIPGNKYALVMEQLHIFSSAVLGKTEVLVTPLAGAEVLHQCNTKHPFIRAQTMIHDTNTSIKLTLL